MVRARGGRRTLRAESLPFLRVSWILLTNDDGVDSPALMPFRAALERIGEVRTVVPDSERSWIGKALTRFDPIVVAEVERAGTTVTTVSGTPADAVQVGAAGFDTPPELVVSGINLGYNHGAGYIISSGTVGAAFEGWELGIPAVAFSAGNRGRWGEWYRYMHTDDAVPVWVGLAELCTEILEDLRSVEMPGDVVTVNIPWEADVSTPRRVVPPARVTYGRIHHRRPDGNFAFRYREQFGAVSLEGTDVGVNRAGEIAITPLLAPTSPDVSDAVRRKLETDHRPRTTDHGPQATDHRPR